MSDDISKIDAAKHTKLIVDKAAWGPGAAVTVGALAFLISQILGSGLIFVVLSLDGWSIRHIEDWANGVTGGFFSILAIEVLLILTIWLYLHHRKINWRLLGFRRHPLFMDIVYALLGFAIYFVLLVIVVDLVSAFFHININQKQELGFDSVVGATQKWLTFVSLVLLPPIGEEILFRGFFFGGLRTKLPFIWAAIITSACFAALHLSEGSGGLFWIGGIDTFILSLVLCKLRDKTGNLWAGMLVHMAKNGIAFATLYIFVAK